MKGLASAMAVVFASVAVAFAQPPQGEERSLLAIGPVSVVVTPPPPEAQREGLTQSSLQTAVELRLRRDRIPVLSLVDNMTAAVRATSGEWPLRHAVLWVAMDFAPISGGYAYSVTVEVTHLITIRISGQIITATIWNKGSFGTVPTGRVRTLQEYVLGHVDQFSNDYLAVNGTP